MTVNGPREKIPAGGNRGKYIMHGLIVISSAGGYRGKYIIQALFIE